MAERFLSQGGTAPLGLRGAEPVPNQMFAGRLRGSGRLAPSATAFRNLPVSNPIVSGPRSFAFPLKTGTSILVARGGERGGKERMSDWGW